VITREGADLFGAGGSVLAQGVGVHQTAIYDMFSTALLFVLLWFMNKRPRREGVLFLTFLIWYGSVRIITDFLRVDKRFFGLTGSQWTSVAAVSISVALLVWWAIESKRRSRAGVDSGAPSTAFVPPREPRARR
jgi:prolipoprotein diacylglyceryltransferase